MSMHTDAATGKKVAFEGSNWTIYSCASYWDGKDVKNAALIFNDKGETRIAFREALNPVEELELDLK